MIDLIVEMHSAQLVYEAEGYPIETKSCVRAEGQNKCISFHRGQMMMNGDRLENVLYTYDPSVHTPALA